VTQHAGIQPAVLYQWVLVICSAQIAVEGLDGLHYAEQCDKNHDCEYEKTKHSSFELGCPAKNRLTLFHSAVIHFLSP
jgi:hypothetical protein